jgi:hypothetical protein
MNKKRPPIKLKTIEDGKELYTWLIVEDEYLRLTKLFGRDFQECGLCGTNLYGVPEPCKGCGKYTEFIDWSVFGIRDGLSSYSYFFPRVWTALRRGVHSKEFIFKALMDGRQGEETSHDAYCSECGLLTFARSLKGLEGGAPHITLATVTFPSIILFIIDI